MVKKVSKSKPKAQKRFADLPLEEQIRLVEAALQTRVVPFLSAHGGGVEVMDIQGNNVLIQYRGACHGCALAGTGTLQLIEMALQEEIDENIQVLPTMM